MIKHSILTDKGREAVDNLYRDIHVVSINLFNMLQLTARN